MSLAVVVLAAGKGTRLKSDLPKVLHPIAGRPLIHHVLAAVRPLKPAATVIVVGHGAAAVRATLPPECRTVTQAEQLGTGHAVLQVREQLLGRADQVLVLAGDVPLITTPTLRALVANFAAAGAPLAILTNRATPPAGLGRILRDATGRFLRIVEERDAGPTELAIRETNSGIGVYQADWLWATLPLLAPSRSGEIYLTDLAERAVAAGQTVASLAIDDPDETRGVNTRTELTEAERVLFRRHQAELGAAGVTFRAGATTAIEVEVTIGAGTEVGPGCRLRGQTIIGADCTIGPDSDLTDTVVESGAAIRGARIVGFRIGRHARIAPGTHLRDGGAD